MTTNTRNWYWRLRGSGTQAKWALANARTITQFHALEAAELVKIEAPPDESLYEWGDIEPTKADIEQLDAMGVVGIVGFYRTNPEAPWTPGDSIWGCAYWQPLSPIENDYVPDIMSETISMLRDALIHRCPTCRSVTR